MDVCEFLSRSYTSYHAAAEGEKLLQQAGFKDIDGGESGEANGYYRVCGGSLFAVKIGGDKLMLALSHTDSPCLRIRGYNNGTLSVERYGGGLLRSFLDRKLIIAGSAVTDCGGTLKTQTVQSDFFITVPSLAVHLGGGADGERLTVGCDLKPLIGEFGGLDKLGAPNAVSYDLYCAPCEQPYLSGADGNYLCSPRIDNLVSVYSCISALIGCANKATAAIACYNSEETGSETRYGACAPMLQAFLCDVYAKLKIKRDGAAQLRGCFAISCDGAHALHPNHPEKYSADAPVLGGGVVIKRNDRYATDALTEAAVKKIFASAGLKTQIYYHNPDMRCGSTVGLIAAHNLGAAVCDIGVAQLAMHSASELADRRDIADLAAGLTEYFNRTVTVKSNQIEVK